MKDDGESNSDSESGVASGAASGAASASKGYPAWIAIGRRLHWWSESQKKLCPVRVTKVDESKKAVVVTFEADKKVWKSVPFSMIGQKECPLRQPKERDEKATAAEPATKPKKRKSRDRSVTPDWWTVAKAKLLDEKVLEEKHRQEQKEKQQEQEKRREEAQRQAKMAAERKKIEEAFEKRKKEAEEQRLREEEEWRKKLLERRAKEQIEEEEREREREERRKKRREEKEKKLREDPKFQAKLKAEAEAKARAEAAAEAARAQARANKELTDSLLGALTDACPPLPPMPPPPVPPAGTQVAQQMVVKGTGAAQPSTSISPAEMQMMMLRQQMGGTVTAPPPALSPAMVPQGLQAATGAGMAHVLTAQGVQAQMWSGAQQQALQAPQVHMSGAWPQGVGQAAATWRPVFPNGQPSSATHWT